VPKIQKCHPDGVPTVSRQETTMADNTLTKPGSYDTLSQFQKQMGQGPVVLFFWANWCQPCREQMEVMEKLVRVYSQVLTIFDVNIDNHPILRDAYGIESIPTMVMLLNGKEITRQIGLTDQSTMNQLIVSRLSSR